MIKYFEIKYNKCEICGEDAQVALNDKKMNLHYACLVHVSDLWNKLNNEDNLSDEFRQEYERH